MNFDFIDTFGRIVKDDPEANYIDVRVEVSDFRNLLLVLGAQLKDKELGEELLIPENSLRDGEDVFLCGMTVSELSSELGVRVTPAGSDGYELVEAILSEKL